MWKNTGTNATAGGEFTDGNPELGQPRSILGSDWLNMMQRELQNLVTGAGLTLNSGNQGQVLAAVLALLGGAGSAYLGKAQNLSDLANAATARANLDVYSKSEAISISLVGANRHIKLPGVLIRMGRTSNQTGQSASIAVSFPASPAFSAAPYVWLQCVGSAATPIAFVDGEPTTAGFDIFLQDRDTSGSSFSASAYWLAIGATND